MTAKAMVTLFVMMAVACMRQGRLVYATTSGDINHHCEQLLASGCHAIGLDAEWRVRYRMNEAPRRTALLQVALPASAAPAAYNWIAR